MIRNTIRSGITAAMATTLLAAPALADLVSQSGHLRIQWNSACSMSKSMGNYSVRGGVAGILYTTTPCDFGGDVFQYKFIDTQGPERCLGRMTTIYGSRKGVASRWLVDGTVPGYRCSTAGRTFLIEGMEVIP